MGTTAEATPPSRPASVHTSGAGHPCSATSCGSAAGSCFGIPFSRPWCSRICKGLWAWSPPPLDADTPLKRWVDRLLPRTGAAALLFWFGFIAVVNIAPHLPGRGGLLVLGIATLIGGGWCSLNFWRCRHAHCLVTGGGWLALSLFSLVEAGLGRSLVSGREALVFNAILVAGFVFEALWTCARGNNALTPVAS
jgi:hypothetical protein